MCGIAGSVNFKLSYTAIDAAMHHRGPDGQNGFSIDNIDFYHLRLSILDIAGGVQPMHLDDRYSIIFNGEIYNHAALRARFALSGKTHSDTETLLLLYRQVGSSMLQHLDGMFVLAIYDRKEKRLFIARDRAGKKPLYLFNDGRKLVFASELNCLKAMLPLEMDPGNFYHYTRMGTFYRQLTPYRQVKEMSAGSFWEIDCTSLSCTETRYWNIHEHYLNRKKDLLDESLQQVDNFLQQAVKRRIDSSDLEVGCFLSGGIDSGLVTAIASSHNQKLRTFTVSFDGEYNEAPLAKLVADKYQTDHTEISISFDHLQDDVEQILANYGEPFFDSSAIPSYYVSREAKKHLTVILNGDGADELFGGYRRYVPFAKYDFFKKNQFVKYTASVIKKILPLPEQKKSAYNYLYRLASLASKSSLDIYLSAGVDILEDHEDEIIDPGFDYMEPIRRDFDKIAGSNLSGLQKLMNMDFDTNLFSDLLVKMDIATMAHSLEGRSPFLCKELLEYAPGMNDKHKINGAVTKYLLRTLAKKYLPEQLINQPKRGFEIPLKKWVDHELKTIMHDYIASPKALNKDFVNRKFVNSLLENKAGVAPEKRAKILWMLFCMEVWYRKVYVS
ncbi:MAG: asparagine synthase (glutamine-hydrolyzing) [Ferruginibacter sp.]